MAQYRRTGTCAQCGWCCGAEDNPNPSNPYPKNWPEAIRRWSLDDANEVCPQLAMFGIANRGDEIGYDPDEPHGQYRVKGTLYFYVWVPGGGCRKDTSAAHDGSSYNMECPFLLPDPGDGTRPCALVGTRDDGARKQFCRPEERESPPPNCDLWDERLVQQWQSDHAPCSYVFEEVV